MKRSQLVPILVLFVSAIAVQGQITTGEWRPVFTGIEMARGTFAGPDASVFYAARIDLRAKGISFYSTPHSGPKDTISDTTSDFLTKNHLQLAINSGFFSPCCRKGAEPKDIMGLAISQGKIVSPASSNGKYNTALLIDGKNHARIAEVSPSSDFADVKTAIAGSALLVRKGKNNGDVNELDKAAKPNPRTALGLSRDGRYLYLVVIDGRKPGYSIGTTNTETAEIMLKLGAYTALNVDGGGSTCMVRADAKDPVEVDRPSGGRERWDAIQLGVRALPREQ